MILYSICITADRFVSYFNTADLFDLSSQSWFLIVTYITFPSVDLSCFLMMISNVLLHLA